MTTAEAVKKIIIILITFNTFPYFNKSVFAVSTLESHVDLLLGNGCKISKYYTTAIAK
jgi:hypothetical protein